MPLVKAALRPVLRQEFGEAALSFLFGSASIVVPYVSAAPGVFQVGREQLLHKLFRCFERGEAGCVPDGLQLNRFSTRRTIRFIALHLNDHEVAGTVDGDKIEAGLLRAPCRNVTYWELGAGIGNLTRQLSPRRSRYVATDIDTEHLVRLRNTLPKPAELADWLLRSHTNGNLRSLCRTDGQRDLSERGGACRRRSAGACQYRFHAGRRRPGHVERIIRFNRVTHPAWFMNGKILTVKPVMD